MTVKRSLKTFTGHGINHSLMMTLRTLPRRSTYTLQGIRKDITADHVVQFMGTPEILV
jgi:hypothetical protein